MNFTAPLRTGSTPAMIAVGVFLVFGACMAALAGTTLVWRGTVLDRLWALNEPAYEKLAPVGSVVGPVFLLLGAALAVASVGWLNRRLWGWRLAVGIIATQVAGDLVNVMRGDFLRGGTGLALASALMFYLLHRSVRAKFR